jgi:hypothetical protein
MDCLTSGILLTSSLMYVAGQVQIGLFFFVWKQSKGAWNSLAQCSHAHHKDYMAEESSVGSLENFNISAGAAGQHLSSMLVHEDQKTIGIGSGIIHDHSVIEDQECLTIMCPFQQLRDVQEVLRDLRQPLTACLSRCMALLRGFECMKVVGPGSLVSRETKKSPRTVRGTAVGIGPASFTFSCSSKVLVRWIKYSKVLVRWINYSKVLGWWINYSKVLVRSIKYSKVLVRWINYSKVLGWWISYSKVLGWWIS